MKKIAFILILTLLLSPASASALSCAEWPTIETAYERYDAVIIGKVESVKKGMKDNRIKISVSRSFKGVEERHITASEDMTWGTSKAGEEYLLFLNKDKGKWVNPLCAPMANVSEAQEQLTFLEGKEIALSDDYDFSPGFAGSIAVGSIAVLFVIVVVLTLLYFWKVLRR
ncbi:hypothetical protein EBB07_24940 [Paenibacillaceae bacterium]|nr:hypothetical protein EBB07_24940 [Paenibacillaceae bacterium]